ncbi:pseudouridine-5'-phosphate glycosidase, partial [Staphylococcus aureus]|uniref:pseudouridine-5'-phosphate glycosidase n=1 Tax=Staphylococcus aureus TaxID=1280 RepID=UPI0016423514
SILHLPKTIDFLEAKCVPLIPYQTNQFPPFFTPQSGLNLTSSVQTPQPLAHIHLTKHHLNLQPGILLPNPIPYHHPLSKPYIHPIINQLLLQPQNQPIKP